MRISRVFFLLLLMSICYQECLTASISDLVDCHFCGPENQNCNEGRCSGLACLKSVAVKNGTRMSFTKGCVTKRHAFTDGCRNVVVHNITISTCYCFKSYCNGTGSLQFVTITVAICLLLGRLLLPQ